MKSFLWQTLDFSTYHYSDKHIFIATDAVEVAKEQKSGPLPQSLNLQCSIKKDPRDQNDVSWIQKSLSNKQSNWHLT